MLTAGELRLLEELAAGEVERLEPSTRVGPDGARYPDAEPYLTETESVPGTLESLAKRGLLVAEDDRTVHICPECESERMHLRALCTACGSPETVQRDVIEHLSCGCTRPRTAFESEGDEYVCPECDQTLRALGVDYAKMGTQHVCGDCAERFDNPDHRFVCDGCGAVTGPADAIELDLRRFEFNEERRDWLGGQLFVKRDLEGRLRDRGFTVASNTTVRGRSGREYPVHLRASDDLLDIDVAVSVSGRLTADVVSRLHTLAEDSGAHPLLVALEESDEDETFAALAEHCGITVVRPAQYADATDDQIEAAVEARSPTSAD